MWKTHGSPRENDLPRHGSGGSELLRPATISCQGARWGGENHNGSNWGIGYKDIQHDMNDLNLHESPEVLSPEGGRCWA